MKVRIISGSLGGRLIDTPSRHSTHVMGDRVRTALFNILGDLTGMTVLDAYAGSGSLGLEALSRGARQVTFVEKDRKAAEIVVKNTTLLGVNNKSVVVKTSLAQWLKATSGKSTQFDLIFADPPYHDRQFSTIRQLAKYLKPNGLMVLSQTNSLAVSAVEGVVVVDKREYGEAKLVFYKKVCEVPRS